MNKAGKIELENQKTEIKLKLKKLFEPRIKVAKDRNDLPKVYGVVKHVSSSGMMRHITFFTISDNELIGLDWDISILLDYKRADNGSLKVGGCGMDMVFSVIHNLGATLWTQEEAKKLNFVSHRNGSTDPEDFGGYLLRTEHVW